MPPGTGRGWVAKGGRGRRRPPQAVSETLAHVGWAPQSRREVVHGARHRRGPARLAALAAPYASPLAALAVRPAQGPRFGSCPPRSALAQGVTRCKRGRARALFPECPRVKRRRGGGALWEEGSGARTVGDQVTAAGSRRYLPQQRFAKRGDAPWSLCA